MVIRLATPAVALNGRSETGVSTTSPACYLFNTLDSQLSILATGDAMTARFTAPVAARALARAHQPSRAASSPPSKASRKTASVKT